MKSVNGIIIIIINPLGVIKMVSNLFSLSFMLKKVFELPFLIITPNGLILEQMVIFA